jgi:hypothetical protein
MSRRPLGEGMTLMRGVTEDNEKKGVYLDERTEGQPEVVAYNEGGYNLTRVDLRELLEWLWKNRPEMMRRVDVSSTTERTDR